MPDITKRGYVPSDELEFNESNVKLLKTAQVDVAYLLDRGYEIGKAVTFVGNRYMFSKRQRMALTRATVGTKDIGVRKGKCVPVIGSGLKSHHTVHIDGFNVIITLETALSHSTLLLCMDGAIRDLCGLHGTYRIIDKTGTAIDLVTKQLQSMGVKKAIYYFDSPVSNSGRLRQLVMERSAKLGLQVEAHLLGNPDKLLWDKENVVSSDAIILNHCVSWINLNRSILEGEWLQSNVVDLS